MQIKKTTLVLAALTLGATLQAEWHYGIGTGIGVNDKDGDIGFNTSTGPATFDVDLDPSDMQDVIESAFGIAGFATNGTWTIGGSISNLELGDTQNSSVFGSKTEWDFDEMIAELSLGYTVFRNERFLIQPYIGVRYVDHEIEVKSKGESELDDDYDFDADWTDAIIGVAVNVTIAENWTWTNKLDAGFGDSEGSYTVKTGVSWKINESWSTSLIAGLYAAEYEEGSKGDEDWYLYDVDTTSLSLGFLYHF